MVTNILTTLTLDTWTAFVHGLLFAAALALVTRVALVLVPPATAATRFAVWFATLIAIAVIPPVFMIRTAIPVSVEHATAAPPLAAPLGLQAVRPVVAVAAHALSPAPPAAPAPALKERSQSWQTTVPLTIDDAAGYLGIYIVIVGLLLARLAISYLRLRRLKKNAYPVPPEVALHFEKWLALCKTPRPVRVVLSSSARSPMAVGFSAPAVILPDSLLLRLTGEELDHIGLHELAHIRRYDDWTNLTQKVIQALFFFNPLVHWIARKIDFEREVACDDWVLTVTGQAKPYARSLAKVMECAPWRRGPILASGAVFRKRQIFRRIEMLLDGSRDSRPRVSHVTLVVVLMCLFGAFTQIVQLPAVVAFNERSGDSYHKSSWRTEGRNLQTEIRGRVEFGDDDISVKSMSPGSYVRIQETTGSTRKKLEIREGHPDPAITYTVNGRARALDEGRAWMATILPALIRETGIGAEERAVRILQKRGSAGAFDEIERISSDHTRRRYLSAVIGSGLLNPDELQRAMARVARLSSDHEKANLLVEVSETYDSEPLRTSYFEAVNTINSDHDRRRVLVKAIEESRGDPSVLARAGRSIERMQSDHDKAQVLRLSAQHIRNVDADVRRSLTRAAESINSDHDKSQVVKSILESEDLAPETLADFLRVTEKIQSDHDKAQVLQVALQHQGMTDAAVQKAFFAAAGTINSDHDRAQVLKAAMERGQMKTALADQIASSAQRISSDHEKGNILEKLARDNASAAVATAVGSINSDHDKRRVLEAMVENSQSVETAKTAVAIAATLSSDNDKAHVLAMLAEKYGSDKEINDAVRRAADRISSDSDYRRIVSKLLSDRKEEKDKLQPAR